MQADFAVMMDTHEQSPPIERIARFVHDNFTLSNQMEDHEPEDWTETPRFIAGIEDPAYRKFAVDLNQRWKTLTRKISDEVAQQPHLYRYVVDGTNSKTITFLC